jgi:hypothetical protein
MSSYDVLVYTKIPNNFYILQSQPFKIKWYKVFKPPNSVKKQEKLTMDYKVKPPPISSKLVIDYENIFTPLDSEHLKMGGRSPPNP